MAITYAMANLTWQTVYKKVFLRRDGKSYGVRLSTAAQPTKPYMSIQVGRYSDSFEASLAFVPLNKYEATWLVSVLNKTDKNLENINFAFSN